MLSNGSLSATDYFGKLYTSTEEIATIVVFDGDVVVNFVLVVPETLLEKQDVQHVFVIAVQHSPVLAKTIFRRSAPTSCPGVRPAMRPRNHRPRRLVSSIWPGLSEALSYLYYTTDVRIWLIKPFVFGVEGGD